MNSAVSDRYVQAPSTWPDANVLVSRAAAGQLLLLPETIGIIGTEHLAPFRMHAQELRVFARENGVHADLLVPDGTRPTVYSEHTADWVLPVVFSVPATIAANLVSAWIGTRLSSHRGEASVPTVRYREARIFGEQLKVRELEGPADAVRQLLLDDRWSVERHRVNADQESNPSNDERPDDA